MSDGLCFANIWSRISERVPDAVAIRWGDDELTFGELEHQSANLARGLAARGVGEGAMVGFYLYNRPEYLVACHACFRLGAVPANINFRYVGAELAQLIELAELDVLIFPTSLGDRVRDALLTAGSDPLLLAIDDAAGSAPPDAELLDDLLSGSGVRPTRDCSGDDLLMVYTGGTTGLPKGVQWRQRDAMAGAWRRWIDRGYPEPSSASDAADLVVRLHADGLASSALVAPPLIHGTGLWSALGALSTGQTAILLRSRSFDPSEVCSTIEHHRTSTLTIVGDAFARPITRELDLAVAAGRPYDVSSLERITSSGTMWSAPMKAAFHRHCDALLIDNLSASEGASFASMVTGPGDDPETARFVLGPRSKVLGEDGTSVEVGEVGRLAVAGGIPLGYRNDAERTSTTFKEIDGQRYSIPGDFARLEPDGSITLLGRGSVCINTAGEKVFPEEVEEALKLHVDDVEDCVVVGVPDPDRGQAICAIVSLRDGSTFDEAQVPTLIEKSLRGHLAGYKIPRRVVVEERVLRSPSGKADYRWAAEVAERAS